MRAGHADMNPASRRAACRRLLACTLGALGTLPGLGAAAGPAEPAPRWRVFPFAQKLDMAVVDEVLHTAPAELLAAIARHGVEVRLVRSAAPDRPLNPLLATLPEAAADLVQRAEFLETYEGRVILRGNPFCRVPRDTILVRDTASSYTLLHEFVHVRLQPSEECGDEGDIELQFNVDLRRLLLYQRRLLDDPYRLLDPQWRQDILAAQAAVADKLFRRIQIGHSQEAIVEKVLSVAVDERSPYHDAARRAQGLRYAQAMIDNAIDLYNTVESAVAFVQEAVANLREEVRAGRIEATGTLRLTETDAQSAARAGRDIGQTLARVRAEMLVLKQFHQQ